ncbi:MAG: Hsp20 family protein [Christensenellaceae bacterium]|nr:Hsp20 family protein [Christensenellaceae bacterium]
MKNNLTRWDKFEKGLDNFGNNFSAMMDNFMRPMYDGDIMRTDVKENDKEYILDIEVPGYDKNNISVNYEDGYITVSARKEEKSDEEKNGYIRQERSSSCSRSYYVGDVEEESIKAKYDNGVLALYIPKQQDKTQKTHSITIE